MSTTWSKFAEQDIAKPTVSDEQQELIYDSHHKVLLTDCTFTITTVNITRIAATGTPDNDYLVLCQATNYET